MTEINYHVSKEFKSAFQEYRRLYGEEILKVCRKIHRNFDILGDRERLNIIEQAEQIVTQGVIQWQKKQRE